jgi:Uncharacterised nucleotidyltransferase
MLSLSAHRDAIRALLNGEPAALPPLASLEEHGVASLVYARMRRPELRGIALRAATIETLRGAELARVTTALHDAGVLAVLIKGAALAYDIYERPELRARADTDLLIDRAQLDALTRTLATLGYTATPTSGDELVVRQQTFHRREAIDHNLDVHWSISNAPLIEHVIRLADITPRPLPRLGPHALGLPHIEALLLACVHRVAHHYDDERLIWLYDIHLLRESFAAEEHARFWQLAAERGVVTICKRSIELAEWWFGACVADVFQPQTMPPEASARLLESSPRLGTVMLADFAGLPTWRARLRRAWQLAFPPRAFIESQYGKRSPLLLPWLYARRGLRGIRRLWRRAG